MRQARRALGTLFLVVVAIELMLVLTGVVDFGTAARFVIVMELCLAGFVVLEIAVVVHAVRVARRSGDDLPLALENAFVAFFPRPVARYVRQDLMLVRAIWMLLTGRRDVGSDEQPLRYSGPLVAMLTVLTVVDGIVAVLLHALLPSGLRTVALVLGILGLLWLFGFVASLVVYPHAVSAERLRLRFSVFHDVAVPIAAVRTATTTHRQPRTQKSAELFGDELEMVVSNQANVVVELEPTAYRSLNPRVGPRRSSAPDGSGATLTRIVFYSDDARKAAGLVLSLAPEAAGPEKSPPGGSGHQGEGR